MNQYDPNLRAEMVNGVEQAPEGEDTRGSLERIIDYLAQFVMGKEATGDPKVDPRLKTDPRKRVRDIDSYIDDAMGK